MSRSTRNGFTLLELLVLILIVLILIGLLLPANRRVRDSGARFQINNNLKQMGLAVHSYHDVHKQFPPATGRNSASAGNSLSLSIHLLPYVEQLPLHQQFTSGKSVTPVQIFPYNAPLDLTTSDWIGVQNFAGNVRVFTEIGVKTSFESAVTGLDAYHGSCTTKLGRAPTFGETFTDGTSNTIMFATRFANNGTMGSGGVVNCSAYEALLGANNSAFFGVTPMHGPPSQTSTGGWQIAPTLSQVNCQFGAVAHSFDIAGLQVSLADASARMIYPNMSPFTWNSVMQPNDGNAIGSDW